MQVTIDIPADLLQHPHPAREALEAYAIAGYRSGALTPRQTRELLGFETRFQLNDFLVEHEVFDHAYGVEEYEKDLARLDSIR
jgi:predicted HTH domain antitoxin